MVIQVERRNDLNQLTDNEQTVVHEFVESMYDALDGQLRSIVLYGSRARGNAEPDSDMDILVVLKDSLPSVLEQVRSIRYDVMQRHQFRPLISLLLLKEQDWDELSRHSAGLKHNIEREGIILWPPT